MWRKKGFLPREIERLDDSILPGADVFDARRNVMVQHMANEG